MKSLVSIRKSFNITLLITVLGSTTALARVGESYEGIKDRLGKPSIEQTDKRIYGWSLDNRDSHYLIAVFNARGKSVAEQVKSFDGRLENEQIMKFFHSVDRNLTVQKIYFEPRRGICGFQIRFRENCSHLFR